MRRPTAFAVLAALVALALAALAGTSPAAEGAAATNTRLQAFGSCGELLGYLKRQARPLVQPWGLGGSVVAIARGGVVGMPGAAVAAPEKATGGTAGVDYSTTNVQEEGIDEPDIVKTDGTRIFAVSGDVLRAVDVSTGRPKLADSLRLANGWDNELLLRGDRLLVLSRGGGWIEPLPGAARMSMIAPGPMRSTLTEVDVSNTASLRIVRTLELDGGYVSARLTDGTARVVVSSPLPQALPFPAPDGPATTAAEMTARNRAVVARSGLKAWLPGYSLKDKRRQTTASRALVQCRNVRRPAAFSGLGLLTVLTIDLDKGLEPVDSDAIVADGRIVYASPESLYVATERWTDRPVTESKGEVADGVTTAIHKFDIADPERTSYRASGQVTGILLNQWSLSEYGRVLRVASTDTPTWWNPDSRRETESFVTELREQDGKLNAVGRVGELGKGERIYAVRFMGDTGYVVTFRQVDPLYTLDLSDPSRPAVVGELKIPGFSSYLHPIGDDLLLGVGQDATDEGRVVGTQLSVFDVSNLRRPARLHHLTIGRGNSEAEVDHHAFLYWPQTRLAMIPVQTFPDESGAGETFTGALGFTVGRTQGIVRLGKVSHPAEVGATPIRRSLVIRGALYTVSDAGVQASSLTGLADLGWAAFPRPAEPVPTP
jgi:uncharacterized secreted protein with C-terminal beta-propeller domain